MNRIRADTNNYTVYVHITPNDKLYIGITCQSIHSRWQRDGYGYNKCTLFWRAIQKYGWDNIKHIVLLENLSKEVACECEKYLIAKYKANDPNYGYNLTNGGEGISGYHLTPEQIEVCRKNSTGRKHTMESRRLMSEKQKGRVITDEMRKNMSLAHKGKPAHNKGVPMSEEQKHKLALAKIGTKGNHTQPHSEETKRKISESSKGRIVSQETREKLRQRALEQWKRQKLIKEKEN